MRTILLDPVGLLALWDESEQWHPAAVRAFNQLAGEAVVLTTTSLVLAETANAAARRPYRPAVARLRERMEAAGRVIWPSVEEWDAAWSAYARGEAGDAGLVDHVSFVVMRRLGLSAAFTNDAHFRAAGFVTLF